MTAWQAALSAAVFVAVGLAVAWTSLDYDWYWDDLHLIRVHSAKEIARTFVDTWDADAIETKGFRPVTVLFNDLRARLFGEWVRGHRIFLIALFSGYLVALGTLVCRFGGRWWMGLAAGVLTLTTQKSFYHYVWISDGIHIVPGLFFVLAAHLLFRFLDTGRQRLGVLSGLLLLAALAAREDALALYPVLVVMGVAYLWLFERPHEAYVRGGRYAAFLVLTFLGFWAWRLAILPSAPNFRFNLDTFIGPLKLFFWTVCLAGLSGAAPYVFTGAFLIVLAIAIFGLPRDERRHSLMWLCLAAITCVPGAVRTVPNLLFLPISFYALFVSVTIGSAARGSRIARGVALVILLVVAGQSAAASRPEQLSLHPRSLIRLYWEWESIYGKVRLRSIPPARLERTKARLAAFGIHDETFDFRGWERDLRQRQRLGFVDDGEAFIPEKVFLAP